MVKVKPAQREGNMYQEEIIEIGEHVICDSCNEDFINSNAEGGFQFGSNVYCPNCTPRMLQSIKRYDEEKYITGYCPEGVTFKDYVLGLRGGDNTIKLISFSNDTPDMIKGYCSDNHGYCDTCSLASNGLDCMNKPLNEAVFIIVSPNMVQGYMLAWDSEMQEFTPESERWSVFSQREIDNGLVIPEGGLIKSAMVERCEIDEEWNEED